MLAVFLRATLSHNHPENEGKRPSIHKISEQGKLVIVPINGENDNFLDNNEIVDKTKTPKPTFTKFVYPRNLGDDKNPPQVYSKEIEIYIPENQYKQQSDSSNIKEQLVSTPMIVFYCVLGCCVIFLCGAFIFFSKTEEYNEKTEEAAAAELKQQLNETLDANLTNEKPVII